MLGGPVAGAAVQGYQNGPPQGVNTNQYRPYNQGGMVGCSDGALVPGDDPANDTVPAMLSPGEAVIPRTQVQQNPMDVMRLLAGRPASVPQPGEPMPQAGSGLHPEDLASLMAAMRMLRGAQ